MLTPLFLALVAIGTTDLLFAFDSIPAVFGVTDHAYIVFAANAFALLGLRPLYFLVSGLLSRLVYLSTGLALILAFIGVKLILEFAHQRDHSIPELPTVVSLAVIVAVLTVTTIASVVKSKRDPASRAHAGALRQWRRAGRGARWKSVRPARIGRSQTSRVIAKPPQAPARISARPGQTARHSAISRRRRPARPCSACWSSARRASRRQRWWP